MGLGVSTEDEGGTADCSCRVLGEREEIQLNFREAADGAAFHRRSPDPHRINAFIIAYSVWLCLLFVFAYKSFAA